LVAADGHDPEGGAGLDLIPADPGPDPVDGDARHELRFLHRGADRGRRLLDVGDDLAAHPARSRLTYAQNLEFRSPAAVARQFGDDRAGAGRADVESGDQSWAHRHRPCRAASRTTT